MACNCIGGNPCPCQRGPLPIVNLVGYAQELKLNSDFVYRLQDENKRLTKLSEFQAREIKRLRRAMKRRESLERP